VFDRLSANRGLPAEPSQSIAIWISHWLIELPESFVLPSTRAAINWKCKGDRTFVATNNIT